MRVTLAISALLCLTSTVEAQDAAAGERVFAQCRACHQVGAAARNSIGPIQNGLFGRKAGTYPGYNYSPANRSADITWDEITFRDYIKDPRAKMPGTKMIFAGIKNEQQITDLIAFLKQFDEQGNKSGG